MKGRYKIIIYIFIALCVVNCGKNSGKFEVINNPKNPDIEQVQATLIKPIPLEFDENDFCSWIVADEKVYLCNTMQHKITILDFDGNVIKTLSASGKGPGEFIFPGPIFHDERNSRIEVFDIGNLRFSYFTYKGDYIEDKMQNSQTSSITHDRQVFGQFYLEYNSKMKIKNGKMNHSLSLQIIKPDTTIVLFEIEGDYKKVTFQFPKFTCNNKYVYAASISTDEYIIDVFNNNGKKVKEIRKEFERIKIPHEEIVRIKKEIGDQKGFEIPKYRNAVYDIRIDIKGNLWVKTYDINGNPYYDIINQKGKIVNQFKPNESYMDIRIRLYNSKLIEMIKKLDDTYTMNIYEITI